DRVVVASVADYNPFQQDVLVTIPTNINTPYLTNIINRGATLGGKLALPRQWRSEFDYTLSRSYYRLKQALFTGNSAARGAALFNDGTPLGEALVSGAYNPFVDTLQHPQVLESFLGSDHGS